MPQIFLIAIGGAIGASLRYLAGLLAQKLPGKNNIITGTVFANLAGSLCAGFILGMTISTPFGNSPGHLFFSVGLIGSLSTFSTFILELLMLAGKKSYAQFAAYLFVQIAGVLITTYSGFWIYNLLFGDIQ
jgi:CrcB protein